MASVLLSMNVHTTHHTSMARVLPSMNVQADSLQQIKNTKKKFPNSFLLFSFCGILHKIANGGKTQSIETDQALKPNITKSTVT
jgi:hypothetical protein